MRTIRTLALLLLIICSIFVAVASANDGAAGKLIFGAIQQEGASGQEKAATYQSAATAIKYINAYFKERGISLRVYEKPQMGTYFETLDRITKGKIDLVVLPSFNYLVGEQEKNFKLLGIMDYPKPWRCVLLVRAESDISNMKGLMRNAGNCKIAYVNELSASGYIVPKIYFTDLKINFQQELFSDGHLNSVEKLLKNEYDKNTVIAIDEAVYEDFKKYSPQETAYLRKISTIENPYIYKDCLFMGGDLSDQTVKLLKEAVDVNSINGLKDAAARNRMLALAAQVRGRAHFSRIVTDVNEDIFKYMNNYLERYRFNFTEKFSADRVLSKLAVDIDRKTELNKNYKPKIALVLSGGGASGSYQVGVLNALDEKLKEFNSRRKDQRPLSFDMVVCTSIGAINGIFYSMADLNGLSKLWQNISTENMFVPYWKYQLAKKHINHPIIMGALDLFALFIFLVLVKTCWKLQLKSLDFNEEVVPPLVIGSVLLLSIILFREVASFIVFMIILLALGSMALEYLSRLENYLLLRSEKWANKGSRPYKLAGFTLALIFIVAPALFFSFILNADSRMYIVPGFFCSLALLIYLAVKGLSERKILSLSKNKYFRGIGTFSQAAMVVIGFMALYYILSFFKTGSAVFSNQGYENLIKSNLASVVGEKNTIGNEQLSKIIMAGRLSKELVITASDLKRQQDVYFYYRPETPVRQVLPAGPLWVSLNKYPEKIIDAAIASSTIVIWSPIKEMTIGNRTLDLVDGGYLHFVPVDAATSLGATHVIIVMCSEDTRYNLHPKNWNFFQYLLETSNFSTYGSQSLDYFGREKKMSFLIAPRERKVDKTDFDGANYHGKYVTIQDFIQEGYNDTLGKENGFRELSAGEFILE